MLEVLLFAAIAVIGVQALIIKALVKEVKTTRKEVRKERVASKKFVEIVTKAASEYKREAQDYRDAYEECYREFTILFRENHTLKKRLSYIEDLHSHMVNNMHVLLKEGRVIKSKYMGQIIPYESFGRLPDSDRQELFGA